MTQPNDPLAAYFAESPSQRSAASYRRMKEADEMMPPHDPILRLRWTQVLSAIGSLGFRRRLRADPGRAPSFAVRPMTHMTHDDASAIEAIGLWLCVRMIIIAAAGVMGFTLGYGVGWALWKIGAAAARAFGAP